MIIFTLVLLERMLLCSMAVPRRRGRRPPPETTVHQISASHLTSPNLAAWGGTADLKNQPRHAPSKQLGRLRTRLHTGILRVIGVGIRKVFWSRTRILYTDGETEVTA